jgi:hypothetical protein
MSMVMGLKICRLEGGVSTWEYDLKIAGHHNSR